MCSLLCKVVSSEHVYNDIRKYHVIIKIYVNNIVNYFIMHNQFSICPSTLQTRSTQEIYHLVMLAYLFILQCMWKSRVPMVKKIGNHY